MSCHGASALQKVRNRATDYRYVLRVRPDVEWVNFIDRKSLDMSVPGLKLRLDHCTWECSGLLEDVSYSLSCSMLLTCLILSLVHLGSVLDLWVALLALLAH